MICISLIEKNCTNAEAVALYGSRPSPGICSICALHSERAPTEPPLPLPPEPVGVPKITSRVASWLKAEVSLVVEGPLADLDYEVRMDTCRKCDRLESSSEPNKVGFCSACGCGSNRRAELTVKGRMPKAKCPLNYWPKIESRTGEP